MRETAILKRGDSDTPTNSPMNEDEEEWTVRKKHEFLLSLGQVRRPCHQVHTFKVARLGDNVARRASDELPGLVGLNVDLDWREPVAAQNIAVCQFDLEA